MPEMWGNSMLQNEKQINNSVIEYNKRLNFSTKEFEYLCKYAGFTDIELEIFKLRQRGFNNIQIGVLVNLSKSSVDKYIAKIKKKILKAIAQWDKTFD